MKNCIVIAFLLIVILFNFENAFAGKTKNKKETTATLDLVTKKYNQSGYVKMKVTKKITLEVLGKTTTYDGMIHLGKNQFRWDTTSPEESKIIFDGQTIWSIQYPPKDLPGPVQVAKSKLSRSSQKQLLISSLFSKNGFSKNFRTLRAEKSEQFEKITLQPSNKEIAVKNMVIEVDSKNKKITEISYVDDVGNKTDLAFSDIQFLKSAPKGFFKYTPPKDAQVTNL